MKSLYLAEWDVFIRYSEISGDLPTCIYLPGLMAPVLFNFWSTVTHPDLPRHHALLVDYLGAGWSEHPRRFDYSLESHARSVAMILDHQNLNNCILIGHSMGGSVAMMLAILRPDLVSNLIVSEANVHPGGGAGTSRIAAFTEDEFVTSAHHERQEQARQSGIEGDPRGATLAGVYSMVDPVGLYKSSVALVEVNAAFTQGFFEMTIPRTFIYGGNNFGTVTPDTPEPDELKQHGIHVESVPDASHMMMFDNLDGYIEVLKRALDRTNL